MKLVDILARELEEWPEGAQYVDQSVVDRELYGYSADDRFMDGLCIFLSELSDSPNEEVTRAQWQEARDALSKPAAAEWDGVGRPPLGTICEFTQSNSPFARCEVVFSSPWVTVVRGKGFDDDAVDIAVSCMDKDARFRPVRTPEQIAAEERETAIAEIFRVCGVRAGDGGREVAQRIYDAGYRKVKDGNQKA